MEPSSQTDAQTPWPGDSGRRQGSPVSCPPLSVTGFSLSQFGTLFVAALSVSVFVTLLVAGLTVAGLSVSVFETLLVAGLTVFDFHQPSSFWVWSTSEGHHQRIP